jgi:undecaprenyl diphosphate synthase
MPLREALDATPPRHIALIMDGNGRWAEQLGQPRTEGHRAGARTVRTVVRHARQRGVEVLTLFAFSSLNWGRPTDEVRELMALLEAFLNDEEAELVQNDIRLECIGEREFLPGSVRALLARVEAATAHCRSMKLVLAVSYDGRRDLIRAVQRLTALASQGSLLPADVTEPQVMAALSTRSLPDVDLLVRTSGEKRLSGFLPMEACYAELVFVDVLWPDFTAVDFDACVAEYRHRERRFGLAGPAPMAALGVPA